MAGTEHGISAFFPACHDAASIGSVVAAAFAVLPECTSDFEIIVVNDGSSDGTAAVLAGLGPKYGERFRIAIGSGSSPGSYWPSV